MKTLNEYLAMPYRMEIVEDREEGGFVVSFPELPGCIGYGKDKEMLCENMKESLEKWVRAGYEQWRERWIMGGCEKL